MKSKKSPIFEISEILMGQSPPGKTYNKTQDGVPLLNGPTEFGSYYPYPNTWTTAPTKLSKKGDLLFCVRGSTTGRMNWSNDEYCLGRGLCAIRGKKSSYDTLFVYYSLLYHLPELLTISNGSVYPNLSRNDIGNFRINCPDHNTRKKIVKKLSTLDYKIKSLQTINKNLEKIIQTIFKSWFIGFDSQKEFVDSESGKIPKGWNIDNLGSLVNSIKENVKPTKEKDHEKYVSLDDMPPNSITLFKHSRGNDVNSSIIRFSKGDILFGNMRPYFHKVGLAQFDGITRTTTFVFRPKKSFFRMFALMHFFSKEVIQYSTLSSIGSTIPYVKWDTLSKYEIVIPPNKMLIRFENTVEPLISGIIENSFLLRNLTKQLNFLIPKLISGEI